MMRAGRIRVLAGRAIMYILLILLGVIMIYPLLWMVAASFRPNHEIFTRVGLIPENPIFDSYVMGWSSVGNITYTTYFINTFTMVIPTVFFTVISS